VGQLAIIDVNRADEQSIRRQGCAAVSLIPL
jgi:hypothetical protein